MLSLLKRFLGRKDAKNEESDIRQSEAYIELKKYFDVNHKDYLGPAAESKKAANLAIKERRFDDAWRHLHEQQSAWLQHANAERYTKAQTLSLLASVHFDMANILRLEKRHDEALAHILYALASDQPSNTSDIMGYKDKKLGPYFRRCKFGLHINEDTAKESIVTLGKDLDFRLAQEIVYEWRHENRGA